MMNLKLFAIIAVVIIAAVSIGAYFMVSRAGYNFEVTGILSIDGDDWSITTFETTGCEPDYSILPSGSDTDAIKFLQVNEVIIRVQIDNRTFEQNLGNYIEVTNNTNNPHFNVMINHIPAGTYTYTIFLYRSYGIVLKDLVLKDQCEGTIVIKK